MMVKSRPGQRKAPLSVEEAKKAGGGYGGCFRCIMEGRKLTQWPLEMLVNNYRDERLKQYQLCREHYERFLRGEFTL